MDDNEGPVFRIYSFREKMAHSGKKKKRKKTLRNAKEYKKKCIGKNFDIFLTTQNGAIVGTSASANIRYWKMCERL